MFSSSSNTLSKAHSNQRKFMEERITGVEKHFNQICMAVGAYSRNVAKLRDKGDDVSKALQEYGESETLNKSLSLSLCNTADNIAVIQDYRDAAVGHLDKRVVEELGVYGSVCNAARGEIKRSFQTRRREVAHQNTLEKARANTPHNRQQIILAETQLQKSSQEAQRACQNLEQQMDTFEQKKVSDIKKIITEFVQTELAFHVKAVEFYTKAFNNISSIDVEEDLEGFRNARNVFDMEFRNALKIDGVLGRAEVVESTSGSSLSPIITTSRERRKRNMKETVEKLQVQDYEEINSESSSYSDED